MDPPAAGESRRRSAGNGGKQRGGKQLGLKRPAVPAPSPRPGSSPPVPPPPVSISPTATVNRSPPTSTPTSAALNPNPGVVTGSPATPRPVVLPCPPQGGGWGAMPPNYAFCHGDQPGQSSWVYPPGGFVNMIQTGENFHLVGQSMSLNQMSPPSPSVYGTPPPQAINQGTSTNNIVNIDIDESESIDANRATKINNKRYWTHEEEERLAHAWLNATSMDRMGHLHSCGSDAWSRSSYCRPGCL